MKSKYTAFLRFNPTSCSSFSSLKEAFSIKDQEVISLIGAGGKTTVMYCLADEFIASANRFIMTTTTHIAIPPASYGPLIFYDSISAVKEEMKNRSSIVLSEKEAVNGIKIKGVLPEVVNLLWDERDWPYLLVEADGSKGKSLKGHLSYEPVIPSSTSLTVIVTAVDILGKPLNEEHVHRSQRVREILQVEENTILEAKLLSNLLFLKGGYLDQVKVGRSVLFINKICNEQDLKKAVSLAEDLSKKIQVVLGVSFKLKA